MNIIYIGLLGLAVLLVVLLAVVLRLREQLREQSRQLAAGITKAELEVMSSGLSGALAHQVQLLNSQIAQQSLSSQQQLETVRGTVSAELQGLRQENAASLDKMRQTVDEKLSHTLEQRLGESFNLVGQRLEQVHQGLGEMQSLAAGVGDLQRLLRNVKIRGTWGEIQLGAILGEVMIPAQYAANVAVNPLSSERVEYALKIPQSEGETLWLPIDSKFPLEDYQRLQAALEAGDSAARAQAANALGKRVLAAAAEIAAKYIAPPYTTDFAILFLPIEGLYAEVLQQSGLCDTMQREYRVLVAGPTTLSALLNVLQVGYRNLAVQEQAGEVWRLLGVVKAEFAAFGEALAKSQKKLQEAGNALELTGRRTRAMERKLRQVEIAGGLTDSADSADSTGLDEVTSEE